ncbi:MAG: hypothetical protein AAF843_16520 [Bacteroidota bacterium]
MRSKTLLCWLLLSSELTFSQQEIKPSFIPPSPESVALAKYSEIPVSKYTGVPNISIPLYEIDGKKLNLPISLSYHASGIKVAEEASRVGLGWSLNAGGVVSRVARGLYDDHPGGFMTATPTVDEILNMSLSAQTEEFIEVSDGTLDVEADIFHFNFNGRSGKFFFDQSGNYYISPTQNIKIETLRTDSSNPLHITGWKFTDETGSSYYFGISGDGSRSSVDRSYSEGYCGFGNDSGNPTTGISSWHLLSIHDVNKTDNIELDYSSYILDTKCELTSETKYELITVSDDCSQKSDERCYSQSWLIGKKLKTVNFDKGSVEFVYNSTRLDLLGDSTLNEIKIYDKGNNLKKSFELTYDYFISSDYTPNRYCNVSGEPGKYRLKLMAVNEKSDTGQPLNPYTFTYNSRNLPEKASYAQDRYGYYNGKNGNTTLVEAGLNTSGADRRIDSDYNQACMLESIVYPTKGETHFTFGPNIANSDQLPVDYVEVSSAGLNPHTADIDLYETTITIENGTFYDSLNRLATNAYVNINTPCENLNDDSCGYEFRLEGITDPTFGISFDHIGRKKFILTEGTYKLKLIVNDHRDDSNVFLGMYWEEAVIDQLQTSGYVGGLRVEKIEFFDQVNPANVLTKIYKYSNENIRNKTSGRITSYPIYNYPLTIVNKENDPSGLPITYIYTCTYICRSSVSRVLLGMTQGGYVGYGFVEEITGEYGEGGKTTYKYTTNDDFPDSSQLVFPFPPASQRDWGRGLLLEKKVYKNELGRFKLVNATINEYTPYDNGISIVKGITLAEDIIGLDVPSFVYLPYETEAGLRVLKKEINRSYDTVLAQDSIEVITDFFHENPNNVLPTKQITSGSDEKSIETISKYPDAYSSSDSTISELITNNLIAYPIERIVKLDGLVVSAQATRFNVTANNKIHPIEEYQYESAIPGEGFVESSSGVDFPSYERKITRGYDFNGNLVEVSHEDGVTTCFLWGYGQSLPVAEITNAKISDVEAVFTPIELENIRGNYYLDDEGSFRILLNRLRDEQLLPGAQVNTYTYDPPVGMTSSSDFNDQTTYYEYDAYQRLWRIKDHELNRINEFKYQYNGN